MRMKGFNFTVIFIIAVFVIGGFAIYAYEHFRYSPYGLQVDLEVIKEWLKDRHVDLVDLNTIEKINSSKILINRRQTAYEFALSVYPMLSLLEDDVTRLEVPLKSTDKVLPLRFKYINEKVFVSMSKCEIPVGSVILAINGFPIDDILEKYKGLYPTLDDFQQKYSFVDKLLPYYPKIIDASTLQIKYQLPGSIAQRTSYIKAISFKEFQESMHIAPVELYDFEQCKVVRINTFSISKREDMKVVENIFKELSNEIQKVIFDLRYAYDGDNTIPSAIISKLIDKPTNLYPKLLTRHKYRQVEKEQLPIEPDQDRIHAKVYFLVDSSCFYTPHKTLLAFVASNGTTKILTTESARDSILSNLSFYTDEFWKVLPNTRSYIVMPLSKVIVEHSPSDDQVHLIDQVPDEKQLLDEALYKEWLNNLISVIE